MNINLFNKSNIISNTVVDKKLLSNAQSIIIALQNSIPMYVSKGYGPFVAAIYDSKGNLISQKANSVVIDKCSNCHAEINVIKEAQHTLKNYDLSNYDLSIYITSEPCMMCLGAIMWSGIKHVFYGVTSKDVTLITGFDEGYKPAWQKKFRKKGITVYGNIEAQLGKKALSQYVKDGHLIYRPCR